MFIVFTIGFLAAAFYFTCRPRKSSTSDGDCCSTASSCCADPSDGPKRHFSLTTVNKVMLWGVTLLAMAFPLHPEVRRLLRGQSAGRE